LISLLRLFPFLSAPSNYPSPPPASRVGPGPSSKARSHHQALAEVGFVLLLCLRERFHSVSRVSSFPSLSLPLPQPTVPENSSLLLSQIRPHLQPHPLHLIPSLPHPRRLSSLRLFLLPYRRRGETSSTASFPTDQGVLGDHQPGDERDGFGDEGTRKRIDEEGRDAAGDGVGSGGRVGL